MCLVLVAYRCHPRYPLIVAANRDEFYRRPTRQAGFWDDHPEVLAGRDLKHGGTWMGITRSGRFATVTNYRQAAGHMDHALSRGLMVRDYLVGGTQAASFAEGINSRKDAYNGFNLLLGDMEGLLYLSNRKQGPEKVSHGVHALSNHLLDTPWPKVVRSLEAFQRAILNPDLRDKGPLLEVLADRTPAPDEELPETGFGTEWERILSPVFIVSESYGTRTSTAITVDRNARVSFEERSFRYPGDRGHAVEFQFQLE
ncbi:MAG: NRDE family protein [bacterium]|nr:MAG: NRDE family protein [bacterium]